MERQSEPASEITDAELIARVRNGDEASFEPLVRKYQARVFATARRYARREDEVADIVQEVFIKAYQKLNSFRGDAPFEHWLMRLAVRTCYDHLRRHQRSQESTFTELTTEENDWIERTLAAPESTRDDEEAAKTLVRKLLDMLSPPARLVITLLEIEGRSVKEIAALTGWSVSLVKVRAFRARAEMRRHLERLARDKYL
ncbi:MAG: sigma-70 family RNA polymerase sigma factor [Verrucomicrobia bacterium]|nr:MAG: sigma-70 family RNA polymerase sigma factor [Verrucomicrobiota bacterium]